MHDGPLQVRLIDFALLIAVSLTCCGCGTSENPSPASTNDRPATDVGLRELYGLEIGGAASSPALFELLPKQATGINFRHQWDPKNDYEKALLKTGFTGGGVCAGDFDGDGKCDLLFTRPHGGPRLLRNLGDFRFEDVTQQVGIESESLWATGAVMTDLNNDGRLDLVIGAYAQPSRVYVNQGNGSFRDASRQSGLDFRGATVKIALADYDGDGDLDAYCLTNRLEPKREPKIRFVRDGAKYAVAAEHSELAGVINLPNGRQQFVKAGQYDHLYQNRLVEDGELRFVEVTESAGIEGNYHGLDVTWWDYNNDGSPDLYVANDFTDPDQLLRNNGDGTFTDVSLESLPVTPWFTMATAVCDINRDGRFDLLTADMAATTHYREMIAMDSARGTGWFLDTAEPRQYMRNALLLNTGTPRFMEVAHLTGLASSDWTWSTKVGDYDNDGREDFFITNGFTRDYLNSDFSASLRQQGKQDDPLSWYEAPELPEPNVAFRGIDDYKFQSIGKEWGTDDKAISFGAALADLDDDGDLDLVVNNFDGPPSVYRNQSLASRIKLKLRGTESNRDGIGATVTVRIDGVTQRRYALATNGFMSADEPGVFFGTGEHNLVEELTVRWPSGRLQRFQGVKTNHAYEAIEPSAEAGEAVDVDGEPDETEPFFAISQLLGEYQHKERPFDDFAKQPMLPYTLSQLGPGMAWADVDGDGDLDAFLAGAAGQASSLLINEDGDFQRAEEELLADDAESEDMAGLFIDADFDGDLDLLVVTGGVESKEGDARLRDRLYLNETDAQGKRWKLAEAVLPDLRESGGGATEIDFDRDGDLDVVIGGRVVPGAYPMAPPTRLLRNDRGRFVDATEQAAADLLEAGMVTSVVAADIDLDGWTDLALAVEFGPIRVFKNAEGKFVEQTEQAGTAGLLGLWNSLLAGDVDNDGDVDLVAGNLGRNSRFQPTAARPLRLYYGDFGDGQDRIVMAKTTADGLMPVRGRSVATRAMPFLAERFPTYHAYASADIRQIYGDKALEDAYSLLATTADSGVLLNDGTGVFSFRPLPKLAQAAPIYGMSLLDANDDGVVDLFVAQNFHGPQRETGRLNGGLGLLLLGVGDGNFEPVEPTASGIQIHQDATATVAVDLNEDGARDLVVAMNNGAPISLISTAPKVARQLEVLLHGGPGNPTGAGATVNVELESGKVVRSQAIYTGGYLSQAVTPVQVALPPGDAPRRVIATWTDGVETVVDVETVSRSVKVPRPPTNDASK